MNPYGQFPLSLLKGDIDIDSATFKALLVDSTYAFDPDSHSFLSDIDAISGAEVAGTGYTAGGVVLTGVQVEKVTATNRVKLGADPADFGVVTLTDALGIIIYVSTGSAATSPLVAHGAFTSTDIGGTNFEYVFTADGIGYLGY